MTQKMTTSDMEIAAKYLRTNDVGDEASKACLRIASALEARVIKNRTRIIAAAGREPPNRGLPDRRTAADKERLG